MPNTTFNYDGAPSATAMEATLLPEPKDMFGYREMFRVDGEAANRDGDSVEYPALGDDFEGDFVEIEKGDPHPNAALTYEGMRSDWQNFGFKLAIHDDDVQDSKVNIKIINQRNQTEAQMRALDGMAGTTADNNVSTTIGDDTKAINYNALVDAESELIDRGYNPGEFLFVFSPRAWGEMAKTEEFTSQTDVFANEFRAEGIRHGEILGYPALRVNTGPLQGTDNDAYLVDRASFGWESPRRPFGVTSWRDDDERKTWYALDGRIDWVPVDNEALLKIVGGAGSSAVSA